MANMNRTKVITGINTKLSYFHGWEPVSINGGAEKYSVSVLIPKDRCWNKGTTDNRGCSRNVSGNHRGQECIESGERYRRL